MVLLYSFLNKNTEMVSEAISAMGNANHTKLRLPICASNQAAGIRTMSCLPTETASEYTPLEKAWNTEPITIHSPAIGKDKLIIRRAGIPIAFISGEELKRPNKAVGNN